ncbi:hypothetical protein FB45DRAFT_901636 [Roridomyces roridus]|uniref:Uncharacterized protein n=1 Tax=Roridomyces roridus TaxID=1738132 RepID=A0AAD7FTF6_9AGAR|nr:hypothetical protein FB45DRAFT_901636 [Roridomyces roridus]
MADYVGGVAPVVTTYGPGNLHHLTYAATATGIAAVQGFVPTTNENASYFLCGFSYYYSGFAFYWDGPGEAFFRLGESTTTQAVGNSWSNATGAPAAGGIQLRLNVASIAASAQNHGGPGDGRLVAYKIPDNLYLD